MARRMSAAGALVAALVVCLGAVSVSGGHVGPQRALKSSGIVATSNKELVSWILVSEPGEISI
jgi:hypothetical protein